MLKGLGVTKLLGLLLVLIASGALACAPEKKIVTVEKPVEVVKEVVIEVPVEKIVTKEVVVEVPKEVVVTKEVVKIVTIEKPVEVVKEVVKEVTKDVVVTKEVVKIVEVAVAAPGDEKVLKMRFKEAIAHLNPLQSTSRPHGWAFRLMGSTLIYPDPFAQAWVGDLAESYEVAPDGSSYTFKLRKGAKFHDGEEVTADDVVWTFNAFVNPAIGRFPQNLQLIKGVQDVIDGKAETATGIVKVDDYTVRFDQEFANARFMEKASAVIILPEHILGKIADEDMASNAFHFSEFVGSGPFMLDTPFVADVGWGMKANPNYYLGAPLLDRVTFEFIESRDALFIAMQRGEIHGSSYPTLTTPMYKALIADPRFNVMTFKSGGQRSFMFNNTYAPAQDFRVRQAFVMALDRRALIDAFWQGNGTVQNTPFQNAAYYTPEYDERYQYNPDAARALLQEAGWDSDTVVVNKTYYVDREPFFTAIQQMLAEVGFKMETQFQQGPAWVQDYYEDHVFDLVFCGCGGGSGDPDGWLTAQFHSAGKNGPGYGNADLDALIDAGKKAVTVEAMAETYSAIAMDFIERMPLIPVIAQSEWWFKANKWYNPILNQADQATSFDTIDVLPVFNTASEFIKYHPEQWDMK